MIRAIKAFFRALASLISALEKTAKSAEHLASVAEKKSEDLLLEARAKRERQQEEFARQAHEEMVERRRRMKELRRSIDEAELALDVKPVLALPRCKEPPVAADEDQIGQARRIALAGLLNYSPQQNPNDNTKNSRVAAGEPVDRLLGGRDLPHESTESSTRSPSSSPNEESKRGAYKSASTYTEERVHISTRDHQLLVSVQQSKSSVETLRNGDAESIKDFVSQRGIKHLVHFTREVNLLSILQEGLVTRDVLRSRNKEVNCNDRYRLDGTDAVCASIEFPNYRMFYSLRNKEREVNWVVLRLDPSLLWTTNVAFCASNAASKEVKAIPLRQRQGRAAMEAMFYDCSARSRASLGLPDCFPTDPQAEVLLLNGVKKEYIIDVISFNETQKLRIKSIFPGLDVIADASYYRWRIDYESWR